MVFAFLWPALFFGQSILLEKGIRVNDLWCFPTAGDTSAYLYLPNEASLSVNQEGLPEFSFLRYVINEETEEESSNVITQAAGGAILHFLVLYDTDPKILQQAEFQLRRQTDNKQAKLKGPIIFEKGRYALISSILNEQTGKEENHTLTMGDAPVLAGSKLAFSFHLTPQNSKLLLESFKMATPDISLTFDLAFKGLSESYNAEMTVNWSDVYEYKQNVEKHDYWLYSSSVDSTIETFIRNNTIQINTRGENAAMDAIITKAHDKLSTMLFEPIKLSEFQDKPGTLNQVGELVKTVFDPMNIRGLGSHYAYKMKRVKKEGHTLISLNTQESVERHHLITFNIGNLFEQYGDNKKFFKTVNLYDPAFQQRDVYVGIDGTLASEFTKMVDNVTVELHKYHESGDSTIRQLLFNEKTILEERMPKFTYGYYEDKNREKWLSYQYRTIWHFKGGMTYHSDFQESQSAMINLYTPYEYRTVYIDGDLEGLSNQGVKAVVVSLEYQFFDKVKKQRLVIRPKDNLDEISFTQTIPNGQYDYKYTIEWIGKTGSYTEEKMDNTGIIFIDPPADINEKMGAPNNK
jgi:hypothetical protein